ncbi:MAG: hypothetical protein JWN98_741 [Abditibacteriota bacterium]|nr:hypothetical protein [Abditibacteriota bacterium]
MGAPTKIGIVRKFCYFLFDMNHQPQSFHAITVLCVLALPASPLAAQPPEPTPPIAAARVAPREPAPLPPMTIDELNRAIGGPTLVSVKLANATAQDAFNAVRKQSSVPVSPYSATQWAPFKKTAPVNIVRQPFWLALRELQSIWNFRLESYVVRPGLSMMAYNEEKGDRIQSIGPCLFSLSGLNYERTVSFARDGQAVPASDFSIAGRAYIDPKVQVVRGSTYYQLDEAIDDKGLSLRGETTTAHSSTEVNPIRLNLPLVTQIGMGKRLARLKGTLGFVAVTRRDVWEVPNVLQARDASKSITRDGVEERYFVDAVRQEGDEYHVHFTVSRPRNNVRRIVRLANQRDLMISESNHYDQVRLVDAQGRDWSRYTYRIQNQGDRQTSIISTTVIFRKRSLYDEVGTPTKLVVAVPNQWREVRVPFEFKDLPLP